MLLTNHVLTGIYLGLVIDEPAVLLPVAVASHLIMDVTPHLGPPPAGHQSADFQDRFFLVIGSVDFLASLVVTASFCAARPERAGHVLLGAFGAALPDLTYIPVIVFGERAYQVIPGLRRLIKGFLAPIQTYERPPGLVTEFVWAGLMLRALGLV